MKLRTSILTLAAVTLLSSCRTVQTTTERHVAHVTEADTLSAQASHDAAMHTTEADLQRLVSEAVARQMRESVSSQQQRETTTETTTELMDSLGRVTSRQLTRTTERLLSESQRQTEQMLQSQMEARLAQRLAEVDSTVSDLMARREAHLRDSLTADLQRQRTAQPATLSLFDRLRWLLWGAALAVLTIVGVWIYRIVKQK